MKLCAGRAGQILNLQGLGNDAGVSHTTAREWLGVLEAGYVVFVLPPLHANISKRLIKSPKLYFFDVGLASYLLGIENERQITTQPLKGALFENHVIMEALKLRYNRGLRSNLHFYRDSGGNEVDLVYSLAERHIGIEIRAGATGSSSFFEGLHRLSSALPEPLASMMLVHGGDREFTQEDVIVTHPRGFAQRLRRVEEGILK